MSASLWPRLLKVLSRHSQTAASFRPILPQLGFRDKREHLPLDRDARESAPTAQPSAELPPSPSSGRTWPLDFSGRVNIERHTLLTRPAATAALATPADAFASTARSRPGAIKPSLFSTEAIPILHHMSRTATDVGTSYLCLSNGTAKISRAAFIKSTCSLNTHPLKAFLT
jgi:hypothetical protein